MVRSCACAARAAAAADGVSCFAFACDERVRETGEAGVPQLERRERLRMRGLEQSGRLDLLRSGVVRLLPLRPGIEIGLETLERQVPRADLVRELLPDLRGVLRERLHPVEVGGVVLLRLVPAGADPEDEAEDDRDPERDESGQPRDAVRAGRQGGPAGAAPLTAAAALARWASAPLLAEVDLVVVVKRVHTRAAAQPYRA